MRIPTYLFPRYNMYRHDRISIYRGGGLCAHVDENVLCSVDKFKHLNRQNDDLRFNGYYHLKVS